MKKRLLSLALALALCLGLTVPALAAEATLEETIPCEFEGAREFSEDLAVVRQGGKLGFIDKTGKVVIPCEYDEVGSFSEGLAIALVSGKQFGFIDKTGKEVISLLREYEGADKFSEGLAWVGKNDKWGVIDKTGKEVVPCKYDDADAFSEDLARVQLKDKWGFIDKEGKEVIPCQYDGVADFSEGLAAVIKDGKCGFIDKAGKEVVPCKYADAWSFSEGLAIVEQSDGRLGFIDKEGKEVIPCQYADVGMFSEGLAIVKKSGKFGFIDKTGKEVVPCKYDGAKDFSEGFAPVMLELDGRYAWGFINKTGKEIIPCTAEDDGWYVNANSISEGMSVVVRQGKDEDSYVYGYLSVVAGQEEPVEVTAKVSDWAKEQVDSAAAAGLIADGLGDDYTVSITRAQFAAVAVKLYEAMSGQAAPEAGETPFSDTSDPAVLQAAALGIVGGNEDGSFAPNNPVTREQAATMLSRVYKKLGGEIPEVDATAFADDGDMSGYAKSAVAFMADKEIVGGVGGNKFNPQGKAAIEEALIIALRMAEKLK